jgi:hypothetical protein
MAPAADATTAPATEGATTAPATEGATTAGSTTTTEAPK